MIIAVLFFIDVVVFFVGYRMGETSVAAAMADRDQAIRECTDDLLGKCGNLYRYAVSLEEENARLNLVNIECD